MKTPPQVSLLIHTQLFAQYLLNTSDLTVSIVAVSLQRVAEMPWRREGGSHDKRF